MSDLKFTLFTQNIQANGVVLYSPNTYGNIDTRDFITVIIHGRLEDDKKPWVRLMKDTYLNKSPANIILVDWSAYAENNHYHQASCAVPHVGRLVGDKIVDIMLLRRILAIRVQINGFSHGDHIAGAAGERVFELSNQKLFRINGLDASNLEFAGKPIDQRLDDSDAYFVQAIHTNNNGLGYGGNYGTIDFEVNYNVLTCGAFQPGCPGNPGVPNDLPQIFCPHIRAVVYYIESINSDQFLGVKCGSCTSFGMGMCTSHAKTIMGEMCPHDQSEVRYLNTNDQSPFAEG